MKRGFASMAIVYSFLLVFLLTLVSFLALYTEKNSYVDPIISEGKNDIGTYSTLVYAPDIRFSNITVNSVPVLNLPTTGSYFLDSTSLCTKGSILEWDTVNRKLYIKNFKAGDSCSVNLKSNMYLRDVAVGSFVSYTGTNGCPTTEITGTGAAQSASACSGMNANQVSISSTSTYGYCAGESLQLLSYGWRVAYLNDSDSDGIVEPYLISAGCPQCVYGGSISSSTNITNFNTASVKYCNSNYVYGGNCDSNVWTIGDTDFQKMTYQLLGATQTLSYCHSKQSYRICGYYNSLLHLKSSYWFATAYNTTYTRFFGNNGYVSYISTSTYACLRPVIHLKQNIYVTGGAGTQTDPYQISY